MRMLRKSFYFEATIMILLFLILNLLPYSLTDQTINFDDSKGLGRMFEGIGAQSANGASRLLIDYPEQQRSEILDYLFKPNFGASLQVLKVTVGGDVQSGVGSELSHSHYGSDKNYDRGYEWWIMTEAKKRNPNIKLYAVPWGYPSWVGVNTGFPYNKVSVAADYLVNWLLGAKNVHNLTIDYVGILNTVTGKYLTSTINYVFELRKILDLSGLREVQIVAADEISSWLYADQLLTNDTYAEILHAVGCRYPGTRSSFGAFRTGKPLWSSEDMATKNDQNGGGCWARTLNQNYVNGLITSTIATSMSSSFYNGLPGYGTGLMNAGEPTSGHYTVDVPIWMTAHTTQFTDIGWKYLNGSGVGNFSQGGTYVALKAPNSSNLTIVIETLTYDHSKCSHQGNIPAFNVKPQNIILVLGGSFAHIRAMSMWYSKLNFTGKTPTSVLFEKKKPIMFTGGKAHISLGVDEVITLTTLSTGQKGSHPPPPPSKPFPLPYSDDFEAYSLETEPHYLSQQNGAFQISQDSSNNKYLKQMMVEDPIQYCARPFLTALNVIGDYSWKDLFIEVDFAFPPDHGTMGLFVATRLSGLGCHPMNIHGLYFYIQAGQRYVFCNNPDGIEAIASGTVFGELYVGWHKLSLLVKGNRGIGALDSKGLFNVTIPSTVYPPTPTHGFGGFGSGYSGGYGIIHFDNLKITNADDGAKIMEQYFSNGRY